MGAGLSVVLKLGVYGRDGKTTSEKGRVEGVPAWSLATACATRDGRFLIFY